VTIIKNKTLKEKELIKACLAGDRKSQQLLFETYAPKMMTLCRRYARHHMEAQDIMQDGFIKMFQNLEKFQFEGSFEGWLRRIMVNTALKKISKKSFTHERIGLDETYEGSYSARIFENLSADDILSLVSELPEGYRIVFNMYAIEGYSHKEIGEKLEIGESTSRSQLVKARRMLQEKVLQSQKIAV
jgi:RNA polymerase sigma-70 factor (ECF subfamily)